MASGRINRNVPTRSVGGLGGNTKWCCYRGSAHPKPSNRSVDRPGVTELPGLTSDPIYTADRRGGILISFGPTRKPERVLNPSSRLLSVRTGRVNPPDRTAFAFRSKCLGILKRNERRFWPGERVGPTTFATQSRSLVVLSPSNRRRHVTRLHTELGPSVSAGDRAGARGTVPSSETVAWPEVGRSSRRSWARSDRMRATRSD